MLATGAARDEHEAIHLARMKLDVHGGPPPSDIRVWRHLEGMEQQAQGLEAWREHVHERYESVEQLMGWLEDHAIGDPVILAGRSAAGHLTGTDPIRMRIYTERPVGEIGRALEDAGITEIAYETESTRLGRRDALRFDDDAGPIVLVRLLPADWSRRERNLFEDEPIETMGLTELRARLSGEAGREAL